MWELSRRFSDALGIKTIAYDASGTGQSPARLVPQPMPGLARQAAKILDTLDESSADVLGLSFGGAVAQELALTNPDRVRRLVLTSTSCGLGGVAGNLFALAKVATPLRYYSPAYLRLAADVLHGQGAGAGRGLVEEQATARRDQPPTLWGYMGQLAAAVGWTSLPRLDRVRCATLVLAGEADPIVPAANSRILASRIPDARLEIVPGAGHFLLTDHPEWCARTIVGFLGHHLSPE